MRRALVLMFVLIVLLAAGFLWVSSPRRVSGVVVDQLMGQPVSAAIVTLQDSRYEVQTGGQFSTGWLWWDQWVVVQAQGYEEVRAAVPRGRFPGASVALSLELVPNSVRGVVRDGETGAVLPGVSLLCDEESGRTDQEGAYTFRRVPDGAILTASMTGYEPVQTIWDGRETQELILQPRQSQVLVSDQYTGLPMVPGEKFWQLLPTMPPVHSDRP